MLFLEELNLRKGAWDSFNQKLTDNKFLPIVFNNTTFNNSRQEYMLSAEQVEYFKTAFKIADLAIVGISHGNVIGPLMALSINKNTNSLNLTEYLAFAQDNSGLVSDFTIQYDLSNLAIYLSHFYKNIKQVDMPLITKSFKNDDCKVQEKDAMCILYVL